MAAWAALTEERNRLDASAAAAATAASGIQGKIEERRAELKKRNIHQRLNGAQGKKTRERREAQEMNEEKANKVGWRVENEVNARTRMKKILLLRKPKKGFETKWPGRLTRTQMLTHVNAQNHGLCKVYGTQLSQWLQGDPAQEPHLKNMVSVFLEWLGKDGSTPHEQYGK